jgi:hypothetical protein
VEESGAELADALASAPEFLRTAARIGVIVQKAETRPKHDGGEEQFCTFQVVSIFCFFVEKKKLVLVFYVFLLRKKSWFCFFFLLGVRVFGPFY